MGGNGHENGTFSPPAHCTRRRAPNSSSSPIMRDSDSLYIQGMPRFDFESGSPASAHVPIALTEDDRFPEEASVGRGLAIE